MAKEKHSSLSNSPKEEAQAPEKGNDGAWTKWRGRTTWNDGGYSGQATQNMDVHISRTRSGLVLRPSAHDSFDLRPAGAPLVWVAAYLDSE